MEKKLNRTIGYKKTTKVVSKDNNTTKVVKDKMINNDDLLVECISEAIGNVGKGLIIPGPMKPIFKPVKYELGVIGSEKVKSDTLEPVISLEYRSKRIVDWIKSHPDYKWAVLCGLINMDKSNFKRIIDSNKPLFKVDALDIMEKRLRMYGL
jgi:hypothetical protein